MGDLSTTGRNRFQPQIDPVQNCVTFLWTVISNRPRIIRSKIVFFRISNISVTRPHAQLRVFTLIKKFQTYFGQWVGIALSHHHVFFRVNQIQQSTASEWTTRLGRSKVSEPTDVCATCLFTMFTEGYQVQWKIKIDEMFGVIN